MIVRISKVELVGPKGLLDPTITLLREIGILQIEPSAIGIFEKVDEKYIESVMPDTRITERIFYEDLSGRLQDFFSYLPAIPIRKSYIEPRPIIDTIDQTLQRNTELCKDLFQRQEKLRKEFDELSRYRLFLDAMETLLKDVRETRNLDFIGLMIKDLESVKYLEILLNRMVEGKFDLSTVKAEDGSLIGLITVEKKQSKKIKAVLSDEDIPEFRFPRSFDELPFIEKVAYAKKRISEVTRDIQVTREGLKTIAMRWGPIYMRVKEWIDDRLSLLKASASVFETRMCFFIHGWMPTQDVEGLRGTLNEKFSGKVVLEEMEIREEDMERIPVVIKNPSYFRPFEIFTRILPLPAYTSYDPTPFIGIFFPLFFGMILGDAGYALLLIAIAFILIKKVKKHPFIRDAARILFIASIYALFFGILYGEFFGELGHTLFHMEPICVERRTSVIPMLLFALTVGLVHIVLGLIFGAIAALKRRTRREAAYKIINILYILFVVALIISLSGYFPKLLARPLIIAILVLTPLLLFTGGLLAPLELLKSVGNIISYARIMAIGLASVLLAFVANRLAGLTGDIVIGIVVAGLLHLINIILGVFSPAIHSIRLHYVEFFSKFIEHGGRKYEPLKKER